MRGHEYFYQPSAPHLHFNCNTYTFSWLQFWATGIDSNLSHDGSTLEMGRRHYCAAIMQPCVCGHQGFTKTSARPIEGWSKISKEGTRLPRVKRLRPSVYYLSQHVRQLHHKSLAQMSRSRGHTHGYAKMFM